MTNQELFRSTYQEELTKAVEASPNKYRWLQQVAGSTKEERITSFSERMLDAAREGVAEKNAEAFQATIQRLGIKNTYKAIKEYLNN